MLVFYSFWEKRQFKNIISVLIFLAIIIGAGARGAIAVFAVFVASYILLKSRNTMARISFTFVGAICFFAYDIILSVAYKLLSGLGIESRTLWLLINDPLHSSGRDILASQARQVIDMKPLFGWGVAGERIIMDNYPHSIILEFLIDYGKPLGLFLLIILGLIVFICFLRVKGIVAFFYTAFVAGVTGLFWSGSYLSDPGFWILLFFSIRIIKTHNFRPYWVQKVGDDARKVKNGTNYDGRFSYFY